MGFPNYLFGRISRIMLFAVMMAMFAVPALADSVLYDNGAGNGQIDALPISPLTDANNNIVPYAVADSFSLDGASILTRVNFQIDLIPPIGSNDPPISVNWAIGTAPFTADVHSGTADLSLTSTYLLTNGGGWDLYAEYFGLPSISLGTGTYYLTLQNAVSSEGIPLSWDVSNGPSAAYLREGTTINDLGYTDSDPTSPTYGQTFTYSESFQILGNPISTPEPATLALLGSGLLFLVGRRRRTSC
jgi:hypothetical protein